MENFTKLAGDVGIGSAVVDTLPQHVMQEIGGPPLNVFESTFDSGNECLDEVVTGNEFVSDVTNTWPGGNAVFDGLDSSENQAAEKSYQPQGTVCLISCPQKDNEDSRVNFESSLPIVMEENVSRQPPAAGLYSYQSQCLSETSNNFNIENTTSKSSLPVSIKQCQKVKKRRRKTTPAQRKAANIRERRRMFGLNDAFDQLRKKVPKFDHETKLSRIETLRLAIRYIGFMTDELQLHL